MNDLTDFLVHKFPKAWEKDPDELIDADDTEPVDLGRKQRSVGGALEDAWRMEHDDEPYPT